MMGRRDPAVIHVVTSPVGGGAEFLVRELVRLLPLHGIRSRALFFTDRNPYNDEVVQLEAHEATLGASSMRAPTVIPRLRNALMRARDEFGSVLVHTHLSWPFFYAPISAAGIADVLVHTEHSPSNVRRDVPGMRWVERRWYAKYRAVVCISALVQDSLRGWVGVRDSRVIYNGARLYPFRRRTRQKGAPLRLVSVGSLIPRKGFDLAIDAVARCRRYVQSYSIYGEGPMRNELRDQVRRLGLDGVVFLRGWTSDPESAYSEADAQLIPSREEGFGLVAVEGMSTGLPVVYSDVGGLGEVCGPPGANGFACGPTPDSIAAALEAIAEWTAEHYLSTCLSSRATAEKFSMTAMAERYAALYAELI